MNNEAVPMNINTGSIYTDKNTFDTAARAAKALAQSDLVPAAYKGKVSNCLIAINMAHRAKIDPMLVMQGLDIIKGTPSWNSKYLISMFNSDPRFDSIGYEFKGEENSDGWACRAYTKHAGETDKVFGMWVSVQMAKDNNWWQRNPLWKNLTALMLQYRAAKYLINTVAPEICLGLLTQDEVQDINIKQHTTTTTSNVYDVTFEQENKPIEIKTLDPELTAEQLKPEIEQIKSEEAEAAVDINIIKVNTIKALKTVDSVKELTKLYNGLDDFPDLQEELNHMFAARKDELKNGIDK